MLRNYMNYAGSKDRYYPLIREFFEKATQSQPHILVDMFCGSGVVSYNALDMFYDVKAYDGCPELISLHKWVVESDDPVGEIKSIIKAYGLSKDNKEGFLALRTAYNSDITQGLEGNPAELYCLITHSFNYSLHLNKKREFNAPSGAGRSYFSKSLETKLINIREHIKNVAQRAPVFHTLKLSEWGEEIDFLSECNDITGELSSCIDEDSLVDYVFFVDPPYSAAVSKHPYRIGDLRWGVAEDKILLDLLDDINSRGGKFVFTNAILNNGVENKPLMDWMVKYKVHHVDVQYYNCNYQRMNNTDTDEVIIYNY